MNKGRVKEIAEGILRIYAAEIFFDELHPFKLRPSKTYGIVCCYVDFVCRELRAVKFEKTADAALDGGTVKYVWSIEKIFEYAPLKHVA